MMGYNRLRLNEDELAFLRKRYPEVDYENLMDLVEGMSTVRNIDILISSLDYDIENREFPDCRNEDERDSQAKLCRQIREKAEYYRKHNGKNCVSGFDTDAYCKKADEISMIAIGEEIGNDIYKIDQSINYIRSIIERFDSDKKLWNIAVYLGTKFGELMLDDKLLSLGFDWEMTENRKYPVIMEPRMKLNIDPIRFVFDKIRSKDLSGALHGTCSDLYYRFLDQIRETK